MAPVIRMMAAVALGTLGGAVFFLLGLPLPWMLGALFLTMAAAVAGAPLQAPNRIRPAVVALIGVMLGSRFTPDLVDQAGQWAGASALLALHVLAICLIVVPFYRRIGRFDGPTAYFAAMPGGLTEMVEAGEAAGANVPQVVLAHSLRIVVTIALVAAWYRGVMGLSVTGPPALAGLDIGLADAAILLAAAVLGIPFGRLLRLPAPDFLGPMVLSALPHAMGLTESTPPQLMINAAQVVLGTILGCRFRGIQPALLARAAVLALGATLLTFLSVAATGWAMGRLFGIGLDQAVLALAPGGLTEMGLIALAIQADVAFVALQHCLRILLVLALAPLGFRLLRRRLGRP